MLRIALSLLAVLAFGAAVAAAAPVQEFGVQLKDIKPDGRFSVVFTSNSFDTTGAPPPGLTEASVRIAKGISIKPRFLRRERLCQTGKLRLILLANATAGRSYQQMLTDLAATQRRINGRLKPWSRRILDTCRKAFVGKGRFVLDSRPVFSDPIPGVLYVFLAEPTTKGAIAGFGVMSLYDQSAPIVRNTALLTEQQPGFTVNLFNEPTPDGLYGYRMRLLPENFGRLPFSVAEVRVESKGIVATKRERTCASRRRGRCVKYTSRKTSDFWASLPECPASGKLQFKADYRYRTGLRTSRVIKVPCPRFTR